MNRKLLKLILVALTLVTVGMIILPNIVQAQETGLDLRTLIMGQLGEVKNITGLGYKDIPDIIAGIIKILLTLIGIIFLILIIAGGFIWMTSAGNEEKVRKAKGILTNSAIGVTIIIVAYAITYFVFDVLFKTFGQ